LILHFKWFISVSLACDTTCFTGDEIGRAYSTYAGIEKCTQNFFFKLSITKPRAPGTLSQGIKLMTHIHLLPILTISVGTAPLHYMPSRFALGLHIIFYLRG
jgi:hypothetical protein